jgi:hypothetical protein
MEQDRKPNPADFLFEDRKEKILENSPLLAAFLGKVGTEEDNQYLLNKHMNEYDEKFRQSLEKTWFDNAAKPLVALATLSDIFPHEASENDAAGIKLISKQLLYMGYELANHTDMLNRFAGDIFTRMYKTKIVQDNLSYGHKLDRFVKTGLETGVLYAEELEKKEAEAKTQQDQGKPKPADDEKLTVFRNFVNTLDIGEL